MSSSIGKKPRVSKLAASPQTASDARKISFKPPKLSAAKPSSKPTEEGPDDPESDEVSLPRTLRLTGKTRTWSAAELLSSDSEASGTGDDTLHRKKIKSQPKGTVKKSLHQSTGEPSAQSSSSNKRPAQPSKKNVRKSGGGKPVGQPKTKKRPRKDPVQCKDSSEKAPLTSANTTNATVSLNCDLPVKKESEMESELTGRNVKTWSAFQHDKAVRQPMVKGQDSPYKCSVQGCPSGTDKCFVGLWLFALPCEKSSAALRSAWLNNVPIDPEVNRPRSPRVCFQHFEKADFVSNKNRLVGLCDKAVPSVRVPTQTNPKTKGHSSHSKQPNVGIRTPGGSGNLIEAAKSKFTGRARADGKFKPKYGVGRKIGLKPVKRSLVKATEIVATAENSSDAASNAVLTGTSATDLQASSAALNPVTNPGARHGAKTAPTKNGDLMHKKKSKSTVDNRISATGGSSKVKRQSDSMLERKANRISDISRTDIHPAVSSASTGEPSSVSSSYSKCAATASAIGSSSDMAYNSKHLFGREMGPLSHSFSELMDQSISVFAGTASVPSSMDSTGQLRPFSDVMSALTPDISKPATTALLNGGTVATLEKELCAPELTVAKKSFTVTSCMRPTAECLSSTSGFSAAEGTIKVMVKEKVVEETNLFPADLGVSVTHDVPPENCKSRVDQIDGTVDGSDSCLSLPSSVLTGPPLPGPLCLPFTSESWSTGSMGEYQSRASSNSIGTTSLTCASSGECGIAKPSSAITSRWDCRGHSASLLNPGEVLPENAFKAASTRHSSQSAKEQTLECAAEVGVGSQSDHTTGCNADFASKDQFNTSRRTVAIGQECGTGAGELELAVVPYQAQVSRPGSGSTCCTFSDHSSVPNENDGSEQSEESCDEWVPFDPSHGKYVVEKHCIGGEDLGRSVYCRLTWLPTSAADGKFSSRPQTTGCRQAN